MHGNSSGRSGQSSVSACDAKVEAEEVCTSADERIGIEAPTESVFDGINFTFDLRCVYRS
jgi:hypothetical protein